jgi:predicted nucleic acid-binding protein
VALLDVNVLIALLDRRHVHHEAAHGWFAAEQAKGWATCPLTQNAVLRILGQPRYPNSPGPPAVVAPLMAELMRPRSISSGRTRSACWARAVWMYRDCWRQVSSPTPIYWRWPCTTAAGW